MKLLWLCNLMPGVVSETISGKPGDGALWVDHVLADLRTMEDLSIRILCPGDGGRGQVDEKCSFLSFHKDLPHIYCGEQESIFARELADFQPDVIHIWGTEYGHTLAMMRAAEKAGLLDKAIISIQGLCSVYAGHHNEGVPYPVQRGYTFRDFVRRDNLLAQQKKFVKRGEYEIEALKMARHVIGRTQWDKACTGGLNKDRAYHFCNETLRAPFYSDAWSYETCQKHRIFASSCVYPVKGFHYLLEAFRQVLQTYPDATLAVPGNSFFTVSPLRRSSYQRYLAALAVGLEDKIQFLGNLKAEQMKQAYLNAHVFVMPSTIENSCNSLGEAMLLGMPCVASDVGGTKDLLIHEQEGFLYQSTAPYMLAYEIMKVFDLEEKAEELGQAAKSHAAQTHDPKTNLNTLLEIYRSL